MIPNLKVIFVSPMKWALQTAYLLFKDYPNFKTIKIIVHPDLRESLHSSSDVPGPLSKTIRQFSKLFGKKFDTSLLGQNFSDYWFLDNLHDETCRNYILREIKKYEGYKPY